MIRVQLWKNEMLLHQEDARDEGAAQRVIDRMINDVVHGTLGTGRYKIDADWVDYRGLFMGNYHNQPWFTYPVAQSTDSRNPA